VGESPLTGRGARHPRRDGRARPRHEGGPPCRRAPRSAHWSRLAAEGRLRPVTESPHGWRVRLARWAGGPALLLPVLIVALWLRAPYISANLPFMYDEDEAHHFHRLVGMVQTGSYNPRYFNKPSLHFYLRMPVVAASFISSVKRGELRSVGDIVTRVPVRDGGWAATASHPRILAWNRAFGVLLGLVAVALVYGLARELLGSSSLAIGAAWLTACAPPLARDAAKVGVDTPLVTVSLLAILLSVMLHRRFSHARLLVAGLVGGLAVSTKYNALPIAALPLIVCLLERRWTAGTLLLALAAPAAGFLVGTPYALLALPDFLDNMAFEAWHYGTAGHGFATGTPGWPQAAFYTRWFATQAIGIVAVVLAAVGLAGPAIRRPTVALTALWFPATFFALMIAQKVNFTRNLLPLLPMLAVLAAAGVGTLASGRWSRMPRVAIAALILAASAQPLVQAIRQRAAIVRAAPDSRVQAARWIARTTTAQDESAVSAQLQLPFDVRRQRGVMEMDEARISPAQLYQEGFDRLVVGPAFAAGQPFLQKEMVFPGIRDRRRAPRTPETTVFRLVSGPAADVEALLRSRDNTLSPAIIYPDGKTIHTGGGRCGANDADAGDTSETCWVPARVTWLPVDVLAISSRRGRELILKLDVQSPWDGQSCVFSAGEWRSANLCAGMPAGNWHSRSIAVPSAALLASNGLALTLEEVHPRRVDGSKGDPPRVGVGLRRLRWTTGD
jgi:hypothetical protein